jgi:hypothetical protein
LFDWYERQQLMLGEKFLGCLDATKQQLMRGMRILEI